jgi:DNA-binding MarR family transcriptional regulator
LGAKTIDRPYVGKFISILYRTAQSFFDKYFEELGISSGHFSYLLYLYRQEGVSQDVMAKYLNVDKANTARAMAKLETLGYIRRVEDPVDRRANLVYLTEQGRVLEPKIRAVLKEWALLITEDLNEEERELARSLLKRMAEKAIAAKEQQFLRRDTADKKGGLEDCYEYQPIF